MSRHLLRPIVLLPVCAASLLAPPAIATEGYAGSEECAGCHTVIYDDWWETRHAYSMRTADEARQAGYPLPAEAGAWDDVSYVVGGRQRISSLEKGVFWQRQVEFSAGTVVVEARTQGGSTVGPFDAGDEPGEFERTFAETMFGQIRAPALECPEPAADAAVTICAAFEQSFSSFKFQWDSGVRIRFQDDVKPLGSWKRKPQGYVREYARGDSSLTVLFADREGRVELAFRRRPEPVEDEGTSTRVKPQEEPPDRPEADERSDDDADDADDDPDDDRVDPPGAGA